MAITERRADPITTEIIRSAFTAAADEMNATLIRSAYTPFIYEMKDCSVALSTSTGPGPVRGLPIFLGNLEICTRLTEEMYGRDAWRADDVWIMNDSYLTGTHLNDMTAVFGPIFHRGDLVGRAPLARTGSTWAPRTRRADELDRDLPGGHPPRPMKVVEGGVQRADVTDLPRTQQPFSPYPAIGDLGAQIACARTGQVRLRAIINQYGAETIAAARDEIFAQTERLEREAVAAIPDGVYRAEGCLDDSGMSPEPAGSACPSRCAATR